MRVSTGMCFVAGLLCASCGSRGPEHLGVFRDAEALAVERVVGTSTAVGGASYVGTELTVEGEVAEVCATARCWVELEGGSRFLRVELLGFQAPRELRGRRVKAQGKLIERDGRAVLLAKGISFEP